MISEVDRTSHSGETYVELSLPDPNTVRWVSSRKLAIIHAITEGVISIEDACTTYNLSVEELTSWSKLASRHGRNGLKVTKLSSYRRSDENGDREPPTDPRTRPVRTSRLGHYGVTR